MQLTKGNKKLISIVAVAIFLFSMIYSGGMASLPASESVLNSTPSEYILTPQMIPQISQNEDNGTFVWWRQETNSTSDQWTWDSRNWLFGPSPTVEIYHENGSLITKDSYIVIGEKVTFHFEVPMGVFTQGSEFGRVELNAWYLTPDWNFSAGFTIGFSPIDEWQPFYAWSYTYNNSETGSVDPEPPFLDIVGEDCQNYTDSMAYYADVVVIFNNYVPKGLYEINLNVLDTDYNWIGSYNFGSGWEFKGVAIGMSPDLAWKWSWGGSYTVQKLDLTGDTIYSVSRNKDFMMRFNITGENVAYAMLSFQLPGGMFVPVNRTGWHQEVITETGGWEYDPVLDTYVWNASAVITTVKDVFGEFEDREWIDLSTWQEVNITYLNEYWDDQSQTWVYEVVNTTTWVDKKFYYIYNATTDSFESYYGYDYYGYPYDQYIPDTWNKEIFVFEPLNASGIVLFELNDTLCSATTINGELVVDFVGHFTDQMPKSTDFNTFRFDSRVRGTEDQWFDAATWGDAARQSPSEFELAHQVTIESPVVIAKILEGDGTEPSSWMFQVNKGENFMVRTRLQGGSEYADDIDGIQLELDTYDGYWTETESRWSNLAYIIRFDNNGIPTMTAYNYTEKMNYTYGTYWDWVQVNKTGWHYELNPMSGVWEWTYGNYTDWDWAEVEGWHWQWWYYNQKTGEWQTEWIDMRGPETVVSTTFAVVSNFTKWFDGGDLYYEFLVNMSQNVPDSNYWWDVRLLNNTWYTDYSSEYGLHQVYSWDDELVWSFKYNGERVYVDPVEWNQLAFTNSTLSPDYLMGKETPYIVINDEKLPVKVYENYDPWSGTTWDAMFLYDHYDYENGKDVYRYELTNGTNIYVTSTDSLWIYNVSTVEGESFLTTQDYPDYMYYMGQGYNIWIDIDGVAHTSTSPAISYDLYDTVPFNYEPTFQLVRVGLDNVLLISEWFWSSMNDTYIMIDNNGNYYTLIWDDGQGSYMAYINGTWEYVSYPLYYYYIDYNGTSSYFVNAWIHKFWYYEDSNGVKHEMPYPGANADWQWDLDHKETDGGKVPTTFSVMYNNVEYPVYNDTLGNYWVDINGTSYRLDQWFLRYTRANGTDIWEPATVGNFGSFGEYDINLGFHMLWNLSYMSPNGAYPAYDGNLDKYYINLMNGTTWLLNETYLFNIYKFNSTQGVFYSTETYPNWQSVGNESWYEFTTLNGTVLKFYDYSEFIIVDKYLAEAFYDSFTGEYFYSFMNESYSYYGWNYIYTYKVLNATYGGDLYMYFEVIPPEILEFNYKGSTVQAYPFKEMVNRQRFVYGYDVIYGPAPIEWPTYKNHHDFIIGEPKWGMWGVTAWTVNEDNGALDLDGNLDTTDDQYFVLEEYSSTDSWTHEWSWMDVGLKWDPNVTLYGDEINVHSWLGLNTFTWTYEWNQTFYWFHADDFTLLNSTEMQTVHDTLLSPEGDPMPGYWDIAWMAENVTWADLLQMAQENGWDWITSNEQTWTWMSFGIDQNYGTSYQDGDVDHWLGINLHYEFSGLMLWEDQNNDSLMDVDLNNPSDSELTHFFIPDYVGNVTFVTPGAAFGITDASGEMRVNLTDEVVWGVSFTDINGTTFPFLDFGYWGWYDSVVSGSDMRTFDERPTKVNIDEISFLVHFQGYINETDSLNNYATIKVDNYIGNWDVDMLGGRDNLENKSLALNYFADVNMEDFAFKANGTLTDQDMVVGADVFELETQNAKFAEMIMGGVTYDWGKNLSAPYDVVSYTTPAGTFRSAYQSDNGQSATAWSFTSTQFYVSIGFLNWDGYSVYQDPVFVAYVSNTGTSTAPGGVQFSGFSIYPEVPTSSDTVQVGVDILSQEDIMSVELQYSTDQFSWSSTQMSSYDGVHWVGEIPPYPDGTQVYYKVVVYTDSGTYESYVLSYIVGQGAVTTTTPGPGSEPVPGTSDTMIMLAGVGIVVLILAIVVMRRRR